MPVMYHDSELRLTDLQDGQIENYIRHGVHSYMANYESYWKDPDRPVAYVLQNFSTEKIASELTDPKAFPCLVQHRNTVVGILKYILDTKQDAVASFTPLLYLEKLYLLPEFTSKNFGSQLLNTMEVVAKSKGQKGIWLQAMKASRSVGFYEKHGYKKVESGSAPYDGLKPTHKDLWVMFKELPA